MSVNLEITPVSTFTGEITDDTPIINLVVEPIKTVSMDIGILKPGPKGDTVVGPPGGAGPPGPQGPAGGSNIPPYTVHDPTKFVRIVHNIGSYPGVTIVDTAGTVIEAEVNYTDVNTVEITFSHLFSGSVRFS
jgi:hypothetical protein